MNKNIRKVTDDIRKGRELEVNLPKFMETLVSDYGMLGYYNLAMDFAIVRDAENKSSGFEVIEHIIKDTLGGFDMDKTAEALETLECMRKENTEKMEKLTSYVDMLFLYEYVLNRIELKFDENITDIDNDDTAREILRWIFETNDNMIIDSRIKTMLSNLPVRMTKSRFTNIIENAFEIFRGAEDLSSVERFEYMLRSVSGLANLDNAEKIYPNLAEICEKLGKYSFGRMEEDEYFSAREMLTEGTKFANAESDKLVTLQEMINALYTALITRPYFNSEAAETEKLCRKICMEVADAEDDELDSVLERNFGDIEGKSEAVLDEITRLEGTYDFIAENQKKEVEALMLSKLCAVADISARLSDASSFAELETVSPKANTEEAFSSIRDRFIAEISEKLDNGDKAVNRAVMSAVLAQVPDFFNNQKEVMDYVRNSLASCHDIAEKRIGVELLKSEM